MKTMEHTERVLEEMLESLFTEKITMESESESSDEEQTIQESDATCTDNQVNGIVDDVEQFFSRLQKTYCDDGSESTVHPARLETDENVNDSFILENLPGLTIAEELKKLHTEYPIDSEECGLTTFSQNSGSETPSLPIESEECIIKPNEETANQTTDHWHKAYLTEVNRALFDVSSKNCPEENTDEGFDAAQEYAIYGEDFLDFPEDLEAIFEKVKKGRKRPYLLEKSKTFEKDELQPVSSGTSLNSNSITSSSSKTELSSAETPNITSRDAYTSTVYSNGTPSTNFAESTYGSGTNNRSMRAQSSDRTVTSKQLSVAATTGAATAATYYQLCSNLQPALRPVNAAANVNASSAYNMLLNNKVTYLTSGTHNVPHHQVLYNQQQMSTTTNFFANNLSQANLGNATNNFCFPNSLLATTTTQQISNTVFKETQYLANVPVANSVGGLTNVNIFERLVYAQMLQQQIFQTRQQQQQQQQAIVAAAMFQQQLQRQQQMKIVSNMQNAAVNVGSGNFAEFNSGSNVEAQSAMLRSQTTNLSSARVDISNNYAVNSFGNCIDTANGFGCVGEGSGTFEGNHDSLN